MSSSPHVVIVFSSGMGHLMPVTRLAVKLSTVGCSVTIIIPAPLVSDAESRHLSLLRSSHPHIRLLDLHLLPYTNTSITDPFHFQWASIANSSHLIPDLLPPLPPLSALIIDLPVSSAFSDLAAGLGVPGYVLVTTSAAMLATVMTFSCAAQVKVAGGEEGTEERFVVPGLPAPIPATSVPAFLLNSDSADHSGATMGRSFLRYSGILINTVSDLEAGCMSVLNAGEVVDGLPEVIPVGPLEPYKQLNNGQHLPWLDSQPDGSVMYVSLGSRNVLSASQMKELRRGLDMSGVRYLIVMKTKVVDKDEEVAEEVVVSERGLVVRGWLEQEEVLKHRAVGGFVSHCGWNSATEAVWEGVPVLAWPQGGDQMINAAVLREGKVGRWWEGWQGASAGGVVEGEEIARRVKEFMEDGEVKDGATRMKVAARGAAGDGGSSVRGLVKLVEEWKK